MLQIRPAGSDGLFYSPERDLAIIGLELLRYGAIRTDVNREPWFQAFLSQNGVSDAMLADAFQKLAIASSFLKDRPDLALAKSGFSSLPWPVQAAVFIKLGQVLFAAVHASRRASFDRDAEKTPTGPESIEAQAKRMVEQARIILNPDSKS